jgi:hypothetical protein
MCNFIDISMATFFLIGRVNLAQAAAGRHPNRKSNIGDGKRLPSRCQKHTPYKFLVVVAKESCVPCPAVRLTPGSAAGLPSG